MFGHTEATKEINPLRLGHIPYIANDNINLLLIKDDEDNGHYIYIKARKSVIYGLMFILQRPKTLPNMQEGNRTR